jgi:hypothetical protein
MQTLADLTRTIEHDRSARSFLKYTKARCAAVLDGRWQELETPEFEKFTKTAVGAQNSTDNTALRRQPSAYLSIAERPTVLSRLQGTTAAPPFAALAGLRGRAPEPEWIGEGKSIPVSRLDFNTSRTEATKFAMIIAVSAELVRQTDDRSINMFEKVLTKAIRHGEDLLLLSDDAAVTDVQPEGLLHGVAGIAAGSPADLGSDIYGLWTSVRDGEAISPYFVLSPRAAMYLAGLHDDGTPRFPDVGPKGGTIAGVPVLTSPAAAEKLILIDADQLVVSDEGAEFEISRNAAVQMDDAPTGNAVTGAGVQMVSAFQTNFVFVKIVRHLHWVLAADDAINFISLPGINGSPA